MPHNSCTSRESSLAPHQHKSCGTTGDNNHTLNTVVLLSPWTVVHTYNRFLQRLILKSDYVSLTVFLQQFLYWMTWPDFFDNLHMCIHLRDYWDSCSYIRKHVYGRLQECPWSLGINRFSPFLTGVLKDDLLAWHSDEKGNFLYLLGVTLILCTLKCCFCGDVDFFVALLSPLLHTLVVRV